MKKGPANKKRLADLGIIFGLLILAGVLFFLYFNKGEEGAGVIVRVDGVEIARYSLSDSGRYELNGGTNILVIENGAACMLEADCPDHICVSQGKVRYAGQCITCLPNKLTVTVYGTDQGVELVS